METLGSIIRNARLAKGFSQPVLANLCEISSQAISNIETGKRKPSFSMFKSICSALDIDLNKTLLKKFGYITYSNILGSFIRNSRSFKGYSQQDLAKLSGISISTIHLIETGKVKRPKLSTFKSICSALDVDLNETLLKKFGYITYSNILGSFIRNSRSLKGYSQRDLSDLSGVSIPTIHLIETGKRKNPKRSTLQLICSALNLDYTEL